jgi:DNA repair exonuclease SbcCD ATPase subunit
MATRTAITREEVLSRIDNEIRQLQAQKESLERDLQEIGQAAGSTRGGPGSSTPASEEDANTRIAQIEERKTYLEQIQTIFRENPEAIHVMGTILDDRIRRGARRGQIVTFFQNVAFLAAGWLLSLLAPPANFFH